MNKCYNKISHHILNVPATKIPIELLTEIQITKKESVGGSIALNHEEKFLKYFLSI